MGLNRQEIIGNLGADPIVRATGNQNRDGSPMRVANLSVATTETLGEKRITEWHKIVVFGRMVDAIERLYKKGKQVFISGRTQTRAFERDGQTIYIKEVVVGATGTIQLLGPVPQDRALPPVEAYTEASAPTAAIAAAIVPEIVDPEDDIPF